MENPYLPYPVRMEKDTIETEDRNIKTFRVSFLNPEHKKRFPYRPGQFGELSVAGKGECPTGIASSPTESEFLLMSLENRMKCGIAMCGRCNIGPEFVCKDGPVFRLGKLNTLPKEY